MKSADEQFIFTRVQEDLFFRARLFHRGLGIALFCYRTSCPYSSCATEYFCTSPKYIKSMVLEIFLFFFR